MAPPALVRTVADLHSQHFVATIAARVASVAGLSFNAVVFREACRPQRHNVECDGIWAVQVARRAGHVRIQDVSQRADHLGSAPHPPAGAATQRGACLRGRLRAQGLPGRGACGGERSANGAVREQARHWRAVLPRLARTQNRTAADCATQASLAGKDARSTAFMKSGERFAGKRTSNAAMLHRVVRGCKHARPRRARLLHSAGAPFKPCQ